MVSMIMNGQRQLSKKPYPATISVFKGQHYYKPDELYPVLGVTPFTSPVAFKP
jgi:hypothetical protein